MEFQLLVAGLGCSLGGAVVVTLADAWMSRLILIYLDALEANVGKLVEALRSGATQVDTTKIDLGRDQRQDFVRAIKLIGWLALAVGLGLQLAAVLTAPRPDAPKTQRSAQAMTTTRDN